MILKNWLFTIGMLAVFTLCTLAVTSALHFILDAVVEGSMEPFGHSNKLAQAYIVIIELGMIHLCNLMRKFVVKEALFALPVPVRWRFTPIVLYASATWLGCLLYLSFHLWLTPAVYTWDICIELLVLTLWMAVLLGTTMPFCAARCWLMVWRRGGKG